MGVVPLYRILPTLTLGALDLVVTGACLLVGLGLRAGVLPLLFDLEPFTPVRTYLSLWPALLLLIAVRVVFGLYPGYGLTAPEELRRQTYATLLLAAFVLAGGSLFRFSADYSRLVLVITVLLMLLTLPLFRAGVKALLASTPVWGMPVAVIGRGPRYQSIVDILEAHPSLGLRPNQKPGKRPQRAAHCMLVTDELTVALPELLDELNRRFKRVWLLPDLLDVSSVWVTPRDLRGHLALELRNNLLDARSKLLKRSLDVVLSLLVGLPSLPLLALLAIWVRLDSRGPVFLRQTRIGREGRPFIMFKFRTMKLDADRRLELLLASNPSARHEWLATRKLRNDPRVTSVGRFLRATSLDELPQVLNIWHGDMSFVGPRPVMADELGYYGDRVKLYTQVRPGLTGLFQVSGRSELTYPERVRLDAYYVRNWSLWLDLVVLARTVRAVVSRQGAY